MDWRAGVVSGAVALTALVGCAAADSESSSETSLTVRLVIPDGNIRPPDVPCSGAGGFRYAHPEASYAIENAGGRTVASGSLPQGTSEAAMNMDLGEQQQPTVCVMLIEVSGLESVDNYSLSIDGRPPKPIRPNHNLDDIPEVVLR
jgi:hypothetical protein